LASVAFAEDMCKGCGLCIDACPKNIIEFSTGLNVKGYHSATVTNENMSQCIGCSFCAVMCPDVCITVKR